MNGRVVSGTSWPRGRPCLLAAAFVVGTLAFASSAQAQCMRGGGMMAAGGRPPMGGMAGGGGGGGAGMGEMVQMAQMAQQMRLAQLQQAQMIQTQLTQARLRRQQANAGDSAAVQPVAFRPESGSVATTVKRPGAGKPTARELREARRDRRRAARLAE
jgi:hypothetical protein